MNTNSVNSPGASMAGRVTKLASDAVIYAQQRMAGHKNEVAQRVLADFTNHVSDEIRSVMGPIWRTLAADENVRPEVKPLLEALGQERGQAWAWIGGTATGAALGSGVGALLTNLLAPVIQPLIAADPNGLLTPETAAAAQVRGFGWTGERATLETDAQGGGIDRKRWQVMQKLASTYPDIGMMQELYRRTMTDAAEFDGILGALGIPVNWRARIIESSAAIHTMADVAAMWNRSIIDDATAEDLGAVAGYNQFQVRQLLELGGEPLSPQDLGTAFRRGFIDQKRFNRGIVQGPLRNEWFDVLFKLQYSRMSTVDAADAVNQNHLTEAEGRKIAEANGLEAEDFTTLLKTAGQPPGISFMQEAWRRGFITEAQFNQGFLESRIKNEYLPLLKDMSTNLIPQETARMMYRRGVRTRDETLNNLMELGYSADDATALLLLEETRADSTTKELTREQIVNMYEERMISETDALSMLTSLGYTAPDAQSMIALADVQRLRTYINSAVNRVKSAYLAGRMSEIQVNTQLDELGVPPDRKDDLLALWDIDRTTITKQLTASQLRQAVHKNLMTVDEAAARLVAQGYAPDDAALYLQLTA